MTDLERARIVIDNLSARLGSLIAENLDLLVRIQDLEQQAPEEDRSVAS